MLGLGAICGAFADVTLDACLARAEENYPVIKRYGLIEQTADINLSDINKSWLPRIGVYAQATAQNVVPEFPETLRGVLAQMGQDYRGLGKIQYKIGADISQTIWDGGTSKVRRRIERASLAEQQASTAVQIYAIREKVMNLYFGILLIEEQIAQSENTLALLKANHELMKKMHAGGVAMQSDADMIEAQLLSVSQQIAGARSAAKSYRDVLSVYVGKNLDGERLIRPETRQPSDMRSDRPELGLFDARTRANNARSALTDSSVIPRIGFFAQAYYGYPGFNYFESMMRRRMSFNLLAGVKISWDIDSFYTKRNSQKKISIANGMIENDRETFLFNTRLQTQAQQEDIEGLRRVMADDSRIVELRAKVRAAAESQLRNGVIDATALLAKITDENQARLAARYHEIQLLQNIYKLKNTLNR